MKLAASIGAAVAVFALAAPVPAKSKPARCVIASAGNPEYRGPCSFAAEKGGSFDLSPLGRKLFSGEISSISVFLTGKGEAEVSGLTKAGINSRWGAARRSRRDAACWDGADFRICVY